MKSNFLINNVAICLILYATVLIVSCTKEQEGGAENEMTESLLTLNITAGKTALQTTKATGGSHGVQADDNNVETLEIFVFRNDGGEDSGQLDAYKKFTKNDGLTNLQIKATTGNRIIYAVANSHKENWTGVTTIDKFKAEMSAITLENIKNFTMSGNISSVLHTTSSITFSISRLISRIKINGIKTAFAGTPYAGMTLSNVKVYLTNVIASKSFAENKDMAVLPIMNYKKAVTSESQSCTMPGMIYETIAGEIGDSGFAQPLYFYAYENLITSETLTARYTRIVIEGVLNGKTYYYPISINREGFGYVSANGHMGIKRNTAYQIKATIYRPGSTDPDKPLEPGTLSATVGIEDWSLTNSSDVEF
jgi:hypothetical protein